MSIFTGAGVAIITPLMKMVQLIMKSLGELLMTR